MKVITKIKSLFSKGHNEKFIEREFEYLSDGSILRPYKKEILAISRRMSRRGHSGMSASIEATVLKQSIYRLLMFEPVAPINLNDDALWHKAHDDIEQNSRYSSLFREKINGRIVVYNIDAVVYVDAYINGKQVVKKCGGYSSGGFGRWHFTGDTYTPHDRFILELVSERYDKRGDELIKSDTGDWWEHPGLADTEHNRKTLADLYRLGYRLIKDGVDISPESLIITHPR
jgi:hypothetical protein